MRRRAAVIGGGISGLAAATSMAAQGLDVTVFEKHETTGGRARVFSEKGFVFDMGPSWYWMPEVMEQFFNRFGDSTSNHFDLVRLDPSYRVFFKDDAPVDIPADYAALRELIESFETGGAEKFDRFMEEARVKYDTGMGRFVWKPSLSPVEYFQLDLLRAAFKLDLLTPVSSHVRKYFSDPRIIEILEFPVLFLGAKPSETPALYTMMNYADVKLGTWYPMGGMGKLPEAMTSLAISKGVKMVTGAEVNKVLTSGDQAVGLRVNGEDYLFDVIVGAADYHHIETSLLESSNRTYSDRYWKKRVMSPSSLLYYVGVNKRIEGLRHHNLFFDVPFGPHALTIYDNPSWPGDPRFYVCCPSKTDPSVAPEGMENLFILVPVAPELSSDEGLREKYFHELIARIEKHTGESILDHVVFKRSYAHEEFVRDYHSFKGNAYGLANTLMQTAWMKPRMQSRKLKNLFYAGQLTVPGPGMPPSLISGQLAADLATGYINKKKTTGELV